MFTGLVEEVGYLLYRQVSPAGGGLIRVRVAASTVLEGLSPGDSVNVSGCRVTVAEVGSASFIADVAATVLGQAVLGHLREGCPVNLERALPATGRFAGHRVLGHVDSMVRVLAVTDGPQWRRLRIGLPANLAPLVAGGNPIAVDGVSLTVTLVGPDWFEVELSPAAVATTAFGVGRGGPVGEGALVDLEVDVDARVVARLSEFAPVGAPA